MSQVKLGSCVKCWIKRHRLDNKIRPNTNSFLPSTTIHKTFYFFMSPIISLHSSINYFIHVPLLWWGTLRACGILWTPKKHRNILKLLWESFGLYWYPLQKEQNFFSLCQFILDICTQYFFNQNTHSAAF